MGQFDEFLSRVWKFARNLAGIPVVGPLLGLVATMALLLIVFALGVVPVLVSLFIAEWVWHFLGLNATSWAPAVLAFVIGLAIDARVLISNDGPLARLLRTASE